MAEPKGTVPQEAGLYLAKGKDFKWWNFIVAIEGKAPMLYISYVLDRINTRLVQAKPFEIDEWGSKIQIPEE